MTEPIRPRPDVVWATRDPVPLPNRRPQGAGAEADTGNHDRSNNQIETYQSLAGVADHLHRKGQHRTSASDTAWFVGKRTTWDARNPVRLVPHEDGGYEVAVVIDGRYFDVDDAQRAANLQRHLLNLLWIDQFSGPEAERMRDEEVERYANWRIGSDDETGR